MNDRAANDQPSKDYIAALEQGVATIDELTAFVNSDKAKEIFGDKLGDMQAHAAELKASGAKYCDCEACKLALEILKDKDYLAKKSMWILGGDGLGLRYRLRRPGPRPCFRRGHQRPGLRYRGVLQHRRPGFQVHSLRLRGAVRCHR